MTHIGFTDRSTKNVVLTQQYDDADEYGDDGPGAEAGGRHGPRGAAVSVVVTRTDFDSDHGAVGQRRVPGIGHDDGDLVHAGLQVRDPQPQLSVVTWRPGGGLWGTKGSEEEGHKIRQCTVEELHFVPSRISCHRYKGVTH